MFVIKLMRCCQSFSIPVNNQTSSDMQLLCISACNRIAYSTPKPTCCNNAPPNQPAVYFLTSKHDPPKPTCCLALIPQHLLSTTTCFIFKQARCAVTNPLPRAMIPKVSTLSGVAPGVSQGLSMPYNIFNIIISRPPITA